jgi:hypothetical protein
VIHFVDGHGRLAGLAAVVVAGAALLVVYCGIFAATGLERDERVLLRARLHRSS